MRNSLSADVGRLLYGSWQRWHSVGLILMYHRVAKLPRDPYELCVAPERFTEHLDIIRRRYRPTRLGSLPGSFTGRGHGRRNRIVVTFDDGYTDNLENAKPLLERYDIPATVFVTTGYLGRDREFWWDDLERVVLQPEMLPAELQLTAGGQRQQWAIPADDVRRGRQQLFRSLQRLMKPLSENQQIEILQELRIWSNSSNGVRPSHRHIDKTQLLELVDGGLIEIGAHTVTHPLLASCSVHQQREELLSSKHTLEQLLGCAVNTVSYPYGQPDCFSSETVALARSLGFSCACTTRPGFVSRRTDPWQLPRVMIGDWSGDEFAWRLKGVFAG